MTPLETIGAPCAEGDAKETRLISGMTSVKRKKAKWRRTMVSPLRYPGSKRQLAPYLREILRHNNIHEALFVEPFAGGASASLLLLGNGLVDSIGLVDLDPLVASFWKVVFSDNAPKLIERIREVDVTLSEWEKIKTGTHVSAIDKAFACFFLNRTSFSGILKPETGPIGGREQKSEYKVDCRFSKERLIKRIMAAHELRDKVKFVWNMSWDDALKKLQKERNKHQPPGGLVFYFDPPFFNKADKLYNCYFNNAHHSNLRDTLLQLEDQWILSYDGAEQFFQLYANASHARGSVELSYKVNGTGHRPKVAEVLLTNLMLPDGECSDKPTDEGNSNVQLPIPFHGEHQPT